MHHILALAASGPPGVFKVFGNNVPPVAGEILHGIAKFSKIILTLILLLLFWHSGARLWVLLFTLILGMFVIPEIFPHAAQVTAKVTGGNPVGSTGASGWMLALLGVMLGVALYLLVLKRPAAPADEEGK